MSFQLKRRRKTHKAGCAVMSDAVVQREEEENRKSGLVIIWASYTIRRQNVHLLFVFFLSFPNSNSLKPLSASFFILPCQSFVSVYICLFPFVCHYFLLHIFWLNIPGSVTTSTAGRSPEVSLKISLKYRAVLYIVYAWQRQYDTNKCERIGGLQKCRLLGLYSGHQTLQNHIAT